MARTAYVGARIVSYNYDANQPNKAWVDTSAVLLDDQGGIPEDESGWQGGISVALDYGATSSGIQSAVTAFIRGRWNDQNIQVVFL